MSQLNSLRSLRAAPRPQKERQARATKAHAKAVKDGKALSKEKQLEFDLLMKVMNGDTNFTNEELLLLAKIKEEA
jgi:hypothetical protein